MLVWLLENKPYLLTEEFISLTSNHLPSQLKITVQSLLDRAPLHEPLKWHLFTAPEFMTWVVSLKKPDGQKPGYSTYNTHRAALFNLFRDYKQIMSSTLTRELTNHFCGLKRTVTAAISSGDGEIRVGKDPLPFDLYRFMAMEMLKSNERDSSFARCFLILSWNLMARSSNTFSVAYNHMEWKSDSLCIYFAHMKNDQTGDRPRDPRHIYANSVSPEICPILAIALYWISYGFDADTGRLFPGSNQYERFRKSLKRFEGQEVMLFLF
jgi:hypothetical protein